MNMFSKNQITKKFILILVLLILLKFILPLSVRADETIFGGSTIKDSANTYNYEASNQSKEGGFFDVSTNFTKLLFLGERAIIGALNNIFCDEEHKFVYGIKGENIVVENLNLTPESIIKGSFVLFDADIFKDISDTSKYFDAGKTGTVNGKVELRNTVAGWYYALRNFAIVALLSVLVYVGIRMITSTISQDKAKYKVMLKDWLVALCLVVVMHYIMITILNLSSMITDAIAGPGGAASSQTESLMQKVGTITEADKSYTVTHDGKSYDNIRAIMVTTDENNQVTGLEFYDIGNALAFMLLLLVIIFYTGLFAVKYLKREFTIIFLILLAPISAVTYPIDKIVDGKAQAFNKWFYEFLYNIIIQPFHLLIYVVLVGSATQLANDNILYSIICFAVMIPAEKFIKEMFGFRDKLGSPLGGFAGGAIASQLLNKMKGGGSSGKSGKEEENNSTPNQLPPRTVDNANLMNGENKESLTASEEGNTANINEQDVGAGENNLAVGEDSTANISDTSGELGEGENPAENDLENEDNTQAGSSGDSTLDSSSEKQGFISKAKSIHNQRMSKKWGTVNNTDPIKKAYRGKRIKKYGKRFVKGTLKTAATGAGALAGGTLSFMMGQGFGKGALTGGALGNTLYKKGEEAVGNAVETGKDYASAFRSDKQKEDKARKEFGANRKQIDNAVNSFRKKNGKDPSAEELEKEVNDRFELSRYGLSDDEIDDILPEYQDKLQELMDKGKTEDEARKIAGDQAKYTSQLAKAYSLKDFRDSKTMSGALTQLTKGLGSEDAARRYLTNAAKMKGVNAAEVALPPKQITLPPEIVERNNAIGSLKARGVDKPTEIEINQELDLHKQMIDNGFSEAQIKELNDMSNGNNDYVVKVNTTLKMHAEWKKGSNDNVAKIVGKNASRDEANTEIIEQVKLESMGVSKEKMADTRMLELDYSKGNTQKLDKARALGKKALKNGGKLSAKDKLSNDIDAVALAETYADAIK